MEDSDDDSMSASPLSTGVVLQALNQQQKEDDNEMKYIDDEDLTTTKIQLQPKLDTHDTAPDITNTETKDDDSSEDEYGISNIKPEPKSAAERAAEINSQRRKSISLRQTDLEMLQKYDEDKSNENADNGTEEKDRETETETENGHESSTPSHRNRHKDKPKLPEEVEKKGNFLAVGATNMDPYLLFWNNSKKGESVVKVVQEIILMSLSKEIHATHFGFGEFAVLASVSTESEIRRIVKKVLNKVSSNVATQKLGPVTLCAGISIYKKGSSISQWVNQCRQACRLAKNNGRGRIAT